MEVNAGGGRKPRHPLYFVTLVLAAVGFNLRKLVKLLMFAWAKGQKI